MKLPERNLFSGNYPAKLKILAIASIAWMVSALGVSFYLLYAGTPLVGINATFLPLAILGFALFIVASGWKWRIDKAGNR